jgi:uncharacterized membrane-anchored protein YitT (DUF2179 family)
MKSVFKNLVFILLGISSATFGIEGFLVPNGFIDGGITGLSMLIARATGLPLAIFIALINVPFLFMAWKQMGKRFFLFSVVAIAGLSLAVAFIHVPSITGDKLLTAVFGGIFLGAGIGLTIRGNSVLDGTEVLAIFLSKTKNIGVGDFILLFNVVLFTSSIRFIGVEAALYSILTYISASKTINFLIYGIEEYNGVLLITRKSVEVREVIIDKMGRGVTVLKGYGAYSSEETEVLYCVITRTEITQLKKLVLEIDGSAFLIFQRVNDVVGGRVKKVLHH